MSLISIIQIKFLMKFLKNLNKNKVQKKYLFEELKFLLINLFFNSINQSLSFTLSLETIFDTHQTDKPFIIQFLTKIFLLYFLKPNQ